MGFTKDPKAYDLDGVANVEHEGQKWGSQFPTGKGDTQLDGVISVDTDAHMTYEADDAFPGGKKVELTATTDLPMGEGARATYSGKTGHIINLPKAFEE
jgi:hypothetical protein